MKPSGQKALLSQKHTSDGLELVGLLADYLLEIRPPLLDEPVALLEDGGL